MSPQRAQVDQVAGIRLCRPAKPRRPESIPRRRIVVTVKDHRLRGPAQPRMWQDLKSGHCTTGVTLECSGVLDLKLNGERIKSMMQCQDNVMDAKFHGAAVVTMNRNKARRVKYVRRSRLHRGHPLHRRGFLPERRPMEMRGSVHNRISHKNVKPRKGQDRHPPAAKSLGGVR